MNNKEVSRRDFLRKSINTAALVTTPSILLACSNKPAPSPLPPEIALPQDNLPQPELLRMITENRKYTQEILKAAEKSMASEVTQKGSRNKRTTLEENLFKYLENKNASAADIILALQAAGTVEARGWEMQLLWQKRQAGELKKYKVLPLDQKRITWAIDNESDPRMLAISREARHPASELLAAAPELFFEAIHVSERKNIKIEDRLPNAGVVNKLNMTETGSENPANTNPIDKFWGYVFIGGSTAWNELNLSQEWFPKGKEHLKKIARRLQDQTGLPYYDFVEYIPGSERGNPISNGSGGAIGPQFMPINALLFMNWYDTANKRLGNKYPPPNPFDPFTGTVMCYLYLASEWYGRHGDIDDKTPYIRPGYRTSSSDKEKIDSLMKWNPTNQARISLDAGYDYYQRIGRN